MSERVIQDVPFDIGEWGDKEGVYVDDDGNQVDVLGEPLEEEREFSAKDVSPAARAKLKGILDHYRKMAHPFATCVRDQVKHGLSQDHAERRCAVIKDLAYGTTKWRSGGKKFEDFEYDENVSESELDLWLLERRDVHDGLLADEGTEDFEEARAAALREFKFDPRQPRDDEGQWVRVAGYGSLKTGDRFRFPHDATVHVKTMRGYRHGKLGALLTSGAKADVLLPPAESKGHVATKAATPLVLKQARAALKALPSDVTPAATPGDAADVILALRYGDKFTLRGKTYTLREGGTSHYGPDSQKGERSTIPVWNPKGQSSTVTVRPGDKVTTIPLTRAERDRYR